VKTGFNTATTFDKFLTYPGGSGDFLGFGAGARNIPSIVPRDQRLFPGQFTPVQLQEFGRAFSDNWEPTTTDSARPALDWSAVAGGTKGRFGLVGAFSFPTSPNSRANSSDTFVRAPASPSFLLTIPISANTPKAPVSARSSTLPFASRRITSWFFA